MGAEVFFRGSILSPAITIGNGGGLRCLAIVALLCSFPHTNIAPAQSKRHHGAYKPLISYQVEETDRSGQGRSGMGRMARDTWRDTVREASTAPQPQRNMIFAYHNTATHHTGLQPTLSLAQNFRPKKYPLSKNIC
jgi:hypothetical protein